MTLSGLQVPQNQSLAGDNFGFFDVPFLLGLR
jgi:hypothetical protein